MRKRIERGVVTGARPCGLLTEDEIEGIRQVYAAGARGDLLIGLCGEERVLTQLLPAQPDQHSAEQLLKKSLEQLRAIGCDGHIHARRVLVRRDRQAAAPGMTVGQHVGGRDREMLWSLDEAVSCE